MVSCLPGRPARLIEDRGKALLSRSFISANVYQAIALLGQIVEGLLVVGCGQVMARLPRRAGILFPDAFKPSVAADVVRAYPGKPKTLFGIIIKVFLVIRG
jgi:hypothetical protein